MRLTIKFSDQKKEGLATRTPDIVHLRSLEVALDEVSCELWILCKISVKHLMVGPYLSIAQELPWLDRQSNQVHRHNSGALAQR